MPLDKFENAALIIDMSADALVAKYQTLLKDRPFDELLHFSMGKALLDAGRTAEGETHLRTALDAKPDWMVVTMLLAKIALGRGDETEARLLYQKGLQLAIDQHHEGPEEEIRAELAKLDP